MIHIALLRAVNLPRHKPVAMSELRDFANALGFTNSRTLLQSGNVVFEARGIKPADAERLLEKELPKRLGLETEFFVRSADEWREIIASNPFPKEAKDDPGHLIVALLKDAVRDLAPLENAIVGRETVRAHGRQLYIVYPDGVGRSKLTNGLIEKKLGTRMTGRNWNTVLKLHAAASE